jgi:hypothetical protein
MLQKKQARMKTTAKKAMAIASNEAPRENLQLCAWRSRRGLSDQHILGLLGNQTRRQIMSDPIFAAIEAHRAAWAALEKDCSRLSDESTPEAEADFEKPD